MKRIAFLVAIFLSFCLASFVFANEPSSESFFKNPSLTSEKATTEAKVRLNKTYGKLPLAFEANEGQINEQVKFLSRGKGYSLFLTPTEMVLSLSKDDQSTAIRMSLMGANSKPKVTGQEKLPGKTNYLIGNDPKKWRTNVSNYKKVRYQEVYPGIDLVYYGNQRKLEYDFIVKPGVDPKAIRMQFAGIDRMSVEAGDLIMHTDSGDVIQKAPIIYQEIDGKRKNVLGNYMFVADNQVGFYLGDYDKTQPLVIDPVLVYSTFLEEGGISSIAVDAARNVYITGETSSATFPTTPGGAFDTTHNGSKDVFVTKLNAAGNGLVYSTFLGGIDIEFPKDIVVDSSNNAYVTGETRSTDFPTTPGAFDTTHNGGVADAFVTKLNAAGDGLVYSTFLGSNGSDAGSGIAVDSSGNAYVTGETRSTDFPTTPGAFDTIYNGGFVDAFVTKLNAAGDGLVYSTFLGSSTHSESSAGIVVDDSGHAYVVGTTGQGGPPPNPNDFPTTAGAFDSTYNDQQDVFVTKLNPAGSELVYSTYLGSGGEDFGFGIALDSAGNAYVTGQTASKNFPTTPGAFDTDVSNFDAFVTKLNASGSALEYSTILSGGVRERSQGIAVDSSGSAFVTGVTYQFSAPSIFPTTPDAFDTSHNGDGDVFVTKLNSTGSALEYSTFLGTNGLDRGNGIAVDTSGNIYVAGTTAPGFPTTPGAFDTSLNGSFGAFVTKIGPDHTLTITVGPSGSPSTVVSEGNANLTVIAVDSQTHPLSYLWTFDCGVLIGGSFDDATSETPIWTAPVNQEETDVICQIDVTVDDGAEGLSTGGSTNITVQTLPPELTITPATGLTASGFAGGPFSPNSATYTITNTGGGTSSFTVSAGVATWIDLSVSGTVILGPNASQDVIVSFNSNANALPTGVHNATIAFDHIEDPSDTTRIVTLTVNNNTSTGTDIVVDPVDPVTGASTPVDLTFDEITTEGTTTAAVTTTGPPSPVGFQLGDPATYIELETTATFTGLVEVCFNYSGVAFTDENNLKLMHFVSPNWVDITTTKDTVNKIICGNTPSFSFFALFEPELPIDLVVKWARVKLKLGSENWDRLKVRGSYSLSPNTDGIDVVNEDVIVKFGGFNQTIPAGSFVSKKNGKKFVYKGSSGGIKQMVIKTNGKFKIKAKGLSLQGIDYLKPVPFSIQIGNDFGEKPIQFLILKPKVKKFKLFDDGADEDDEEDENEFDNDD